MNRSHRHSVRAVLVGGVALFALVSSAAYAQNQTTETVEVTATRLNLAGFEAPTPTTVVGADMIEKVNKPNIFDVVNQMPSMVNSNTAQTGTHGTSGGDNGLQSFNMFGLGAQRTLTLLDGQRFVEANAEGVPDIAGWPHLLIQRVDVVTGGASASWGSDALAGVVNFVTDKKFVGIKSELSGGVSTYGDDITLHAALAAGTSFLGGRGHEEFSVEYDHTDGLPGGQYGYGQPRPWYQGQRMLAYTSPAATPAGQPQYFASYNTQDNQRARYGLINSGPLMGTAFQADGTPYQFNYGSGTNGVQGVPAKNGSASATGSVTNCVSSFCIGGDVGGDLGNGIGLVQASTRGDFYNRVSYDIDKDTNAYMTFALSDVGTQAVSFPTSSFNTFPGIAANTNGQVVQLPGIQCGLGPTAAQLPAGDLAGPNAYLPASINQACVTNNIRNFSFGDTLADVTASNYIKTERVTWRAAVGADGAFDLFGSDWNWSGYYTHGQTRTADHIGPITLNPYLFAAIDAVTAQAGDGSGAVPGTIVCRNATARAEGCVPINLFGNHPLSPSQLNWIYGGAKWNGTHTDIQDLGEDAASFSVNGTPFSLWAGKLAVAAGVEYRQETMDVRADGAGAGSQPGSFGAPASSCNDPLLNCVGGNNWYAGNFHNGHGNYHVSEAFVEFGIPLMNSPTFGSADLDLAGRYELYAPAGDFATWKVGLNYDTPISGLRLRTLMSRDVHTPTLNDLFAPFTTAKAAPNDPWTGQNVGTLQQNGGNPLLKPERSTNTQLGFVYAPDWISGFQMSVDYYRYGVAAAISSVDYQTAINLCYAGLTQYCSAIVTASGAAPGVDPNWTLIKNTTFNVASLVTDGFTYQATYDLNMEDVGLAGDLNLRALATNVSKYITTPGIPGTFAFDAAGSNGLNDLNRNNTSIPHWLLQGYQTYTFDDESLLKGTSITLAERFISSGKEDNNAIQCVPGSCPASTLQHPTINDNHMPGIVYFNLGVNHNVTDSLQTYVQIDNLLNKDPPPFFYNNYNTRPTNWQLYDVVGRMITVGVRFKH